MSKGSLKLIRIALRRKVERKINKKNKARILGKRKDTEVGEIQQLFAAFFGIK